MDTLYILFGLGAIIVLMASLLGISFRRKKRIFKSFIALWYRINLYYNRKAPHELRGDLIHWEKGDKIIETAAIKSETGYWREQECIFLGFLETSFVIAKDKYLKELPAHRVAYYRNEKAVDRMAGIERFRLESKLKTSMYAQLLDTLKEQNKEFEAQVRQLEGV